MTDTLPSTAPCRTSSDKPLLLYILLALALLWVMQTGTAKSLFLTGAIRDTDDALRLTQVRDFLNGQNWFDVRQYRIMQQDGGLLMHWSRLIDAPLAMLVWVFDLFLPRANAEIAMRFVWPALLQIGLVVTVLSITRRLAGSTALFAAAVVTGFCYIVAAQFAPGRIDHHSAELLLEAVCALLILKAFDKPRHAFAAGCLAALMLTIAFEALLIVAVFAAFLALRWIVIGHDAARALRWFGGGFAVAALALYAATTPQADYFTVACDGQSFASLAFSLGAGFVAAALAAATPWLRTWMTRSGAAAFGGITLLGVMALIAPQCARGPFAAVPSDVIALWMDQIYEAIGLGVHFVADPLGTLPFAGPLCIAVLCALFAVYADKDRRWAGGLLAAQCLASTVMAFDRLSTIGPAMLFALPAMAFTITRLRARSQLAMAALYILSVPAFWALPSLYVSEEDDGVGGASACFEQKSFDVLKAQPQGNVLAPVDLGSHTLAFTAHGVYGAPYHRNADGIRFSKTVFTQDPKDALEQIRLRKPDYILLCPKLSELKDIDKDKPQSFGAQLLGGKVFPGIAPVDIKGDNRIWRVK